ncbi:MAG: hypothetical protein QOH43_3332 [Solirubrobacteraceae bacterium]|jgi:hypothetical protein|nr:hypothetical protein [Solirubrobacteraceae bacterium]
MHAVSQRATATAVSAEEAHAIGVEAYVYLYPLVVMELTRRQMTNLPPGQKPGFGPMNAFTHVREFPPADFKAVVRPNFDTLYSVAWLDLSTEPLIVSVPDTGGRYYLLPLYDMWTDAFAVPGKRTSGTGAASYALIPPGWTGVLPAGIEAIESPTSGVWIVGRTQTNGPGDYDAVHEVQDGMSITPLSRWGQAPAPPEVAVDPAVDMETPPPQQVDAMSAVDFFDLASALMKPHPPHLTDWSVLARMRRIGLRPGEGFSAERLDPDVAAALKDVPAEAQRLMRDKLPTLARVVDGWQMNTDTMGVYGDYYLKRAVVTMAGLGANPTEDAVYPLSMADAGGQPLDGDHAYVLHFEHDELPPVDAFWSVTMYDAEGYQAANAINRFAIGDRDDLRFDADGSLDLLLQHEHPGADKESNWLPAPRGPLGVTMRLYAPRPEVLDGRWAPPAIRRA